MFTKQECLYMKIALKEAKAAFDDNEVPVGAIIVKDNEIIGSGHNQVIKNKNIASHAEINAIINASKNINNYRLKDAKIYVTLEPCHMCAKAILDARIEEVIFGALEPKTGSIVSIDNFYNRIQSNHNVKYRYGLLSEKSSKLLKNFFKNKR